MTNLDRNSWLPVIVIALAMLGALVLAVIGTIWHTRETDD